MRVQKIRKSQVTKTSFLLILLALMAVWFVVAVGFWWKVVYTDPERVFWDAIANNFSTSGYSRLSSIKTDDYSELSTSQIQYGQQNVAETHIAINSPESKMKAEVISTPDSDYLRYVTDTSIDPDSNRGKALGVWAKNDGGSDSNQSFNTLTLLSTMFPMGYIPAATRADLVNFAKNNVAYSPDVTNIVTEEVNGRRVYTYEVSVQLQSYASLLQQFAEATGQGDVTAGISPADYAGSQPIPLEVSIDPISRRIVRVMSPGNDTTIEAYRGYGISTKEVKMPEKPLSTLQLQELLQQE